MGRKYFGTDGVRGRVGEGLINPEFALRLGFAAGTTLVDLETLPAGERPAVLIGKDTRISGYMLEGALESGFSAAGVDVMLSGPLPTPAIAYLTRALRLQAGVVISATPLLSADASSCSPFSSVSTSAPLRSRPPCSTKTVRLFEPLAIPIRWPGLRRGLPNRTRPTG